MRKLLASLTVFALGLALAPVASAETVVREYCYDRPVYETVEVTREFGSRTFTYERLIRTGTEEVCKTFTYDRPEAPEAPEAPEFPTS